MTPLDWTVLVVYFAVLLGIGLLPSRKASAGADDYFVSGRTLPWWMAGTSLIAASFASDTPLLVSGLVRSKGLWGNWLWWGVGISAVLTVFLFAPLWRAASVLTDAELAEIRYSGRSAAFLRGSKSIYWGVLFNCYTTGAWAVTGGVKVIGVVTGFSPGQSLLLCTILGASYAIVSGLWGLVMTDMFQFVVAIVGSILTAAFAIHAAGGWGSVLAATPPDHLEILPLSGPGLEYALPFLLVQWWAWKNTDGSGVMVQRWASCKDQRHAIGATLWYTLVHYGLRCWPWVMVGLASIVLVPASHLPLRDGVPDAEAAYPIVIRDVLPAGLRGFVVAWFFAEFMSAIAQAMNWGGSLLVNDAYRRFIRREAPAAHYVAVGRVASLVVMVGAVGAALCTDSISKAFAYVLSMTAAIGVVSALRWLWWRINAWSEIVAMILSPVITFLLVDDFMAFWPIPDTPLARTIAIVLGGTIPALLIAFLTGPADRERLKAFYRRVRPPGPGWGPIARECPEVRPAISLPRVAGCWLLGLGLVYGTMWGVGGSLFGRQPQGAIGGTVALLSGIALWVTMRRTTSSAASSPLPSPAAPPRSAD